MRSLEDAAEGALEVLPWGGGCREDGREPEAGLEGGRTLSLDGVLEAGLDLSADCPREAADAARVAD